MTEKRIAKPLIQVLLWMFPVLFLIDNILGFNGYQFTIAGKSIRIILFCISVALLYCYCLFVIIRDKIALYSKDKEKTTILKMLNPLDYLVLLFIFGNAIWATAVPLLVRGEMTFALKDYSTILVLVLYFPIAFLIRTGKLSLKVLEKMTYVLIILLALWHAVMYIGDTIRPGFYESYYDFIDIISFGTAVRSGVIYGYGIVRVIQTTSIFLLLGVFMALRYLVKGKWWHLISLALFTFAICVTYTKSIWFGYILGLVIYLVPCIFVKKEVRINSAVALAVAISLIIVFNYTVFDNTIFSRAFNTVRTSNSISQMQSQLQQMQSKPTDSDSTDSSSSTDSSDTQSSAPSFTEQDKTKLENEIKDAVGTQQANAIRAQQNSALFKKFKESKLVGFGYGGYTEECIRHKIYPYMYESTLPALVMKLGIIGCLVWIIFIGGTTIFAVGSFWKEKREDVFYWLGFAISYALAVQTNPLLFTFAGFSMLLYLLVCVQKKTFSKE